MDSASISHATSPNEALSQLERPRDIRQAAQAVEALFVEQLMGEMRKAVPEGGLFKKGFAEKTFQQMLDRTFAGLMAKRGGVGIAETLERSWGVREPLQPDTDGALVRPADEEIALEGADSTTETRKEKKIAE